MFGQEVFSMRLLFMLLFVAPILCAAEPASVGKLRETGVRGISAALWSTENGLKFREKGLNANLLWTYILRDAVSGAEGSEVTGAKLPRLPQLELEARVAAESGMYSFFYIWLHTDTLPFLERGSARRCVDASGRECKSTPCPTDEVYWRRILTPLLVRCAEIQNKYGTNGGGAVDFEFYTGELAGGYCYDATALRGCYCDSCFDGFLTMKGAQVTVVEKSERPEYISRHFGVKVYQEYLGERVRGEAARLAQAVRVVKKDFLLGLLPGIDGWFLSNAARGFASAGLPVVVFDESTYFDGNNAESRNRCDALKKSGVDLIHVGGLTVGAFNAEGLAAKAAELAHATDGYWLYHGETLRSAKPRIEPEGNSEWALREAPEHYWQALEAASRFLDSGEKPGGEHFRSIPLINAEFFPELPPGIQADADCFRFSGAASTETLLGNADFKRPLQEGWRFSHSGASRGPGQFTFDFDPPEVPRWAWLSQKLKTRPGHRYVIESEWENRGLVSHWPPHMRIVNGKKILAEGKANLPAQGHAKTRKVIFKAPEEPLSLSFLVHGRKGACSLRSISCFELPPELISGKLPLNEAISLDFRPLQPGDYTAELRNPETGTGYFRLRHGDNSLWYLRRLFPASPAVIALQPVFPQTMRKGCFEKLELRCNQ